MTTRILAPEAARRRVRLPNVVRRPLVWTVILSWPESTVARYIEQYLPGAKTARRGRCCAIQHPSFESYGEDGLYDIALAKGLPLLGVERMPAI